MSAHLRISRSITLCLGLMLTLASTLYGEDTPTAPASTVERWYKVEIGDTPAGWTVEREVRRSGTLTTSSILHLNFARGPSQQSLKLESRFVETEDGKPVSAWALQNLTSSALETKWRFYPDKVLVETTHGEQSRRQSMPWPEGQWLTPGQTATTLQRMIADKRERFTLSGLDPQWGLEVVATEWILDERDIELSIDDQPRLAHRFRQVSRNAPGLPILADVDAGGQLLRMKTSMMGIEMTVTLTSREEALKSRGAPDLLSSSFIYPDRPIHQPRQVRRAVYEIRGGIDTLNLPSVGSQHAEASEEGIRVVVDVEESSKLSSAELEKREDFLAASTFIDHQNPKILELLTGARSDEADALSRAEALRVFVSEYLDEKNLDSILATASEVAASRSGDCTEHSMLLAALLRASGIPSRLATGLVYVEEMIGASNFFGYHMWTQALIDDRWIDLDATLSTRFDAAHLTFGTTAMNDEHGALAELTKLAVLLEGAEILVLEVEP